VASRQLRLFALASVLWGVPYLLIAVALTGFSATTMVWLRVAVAAVLLAGVVGPRSLARSMRGHLRAVCGFALVQFTVPLLLIAEAERSVPSSLVGSLVASEPLWVALLASRVDRAQRTHTTGAVGLVAGLLGVAILLGVDAAGGVGGALLVVIAAGCYALAMLLVKRLSATVPLLHLIAAGLAITALTLLPIVVASPPDQVPGAKAIAAVLGLAVVCTAVAFPVWFALIARVGAGRASLVTYASPVVAVALGVALLGERPGRLAPLGLALILAGSWAASRADAKVVARTPGQRAQGATAAQAPRPNAMTTRPA
jgi:drug/metabolite transporter (DMT)-like permease